MGNGTRCSVKYMLKWHTTSTEQNRYDFITCCDVNVKKQMLKVRNICFEIKFCECLSKSMI